MPRPRGKRHSWKKAGEKATCTSCGLKVDIRLIRKNVSHLPSRILTDVGKVVGLMVKHSVKEGTCLKEWNLERSPILQKGDMVTILAESGDLRITVPGRVLEKAYSGGFVRVQNSMSKKEIHARVVNHSTVRVSF